MFRNTRWEFSRIFAPANQRISSYFSESYNLGKGYQEDQVVQPGQGRAVASNHCHQVGMTPWNYQFINLKLKV